MKKGLFLTVKMPVIVGIVDDSLILFEALPRGLGLPHG